MPNCQFVYNETTDSKWGCMRIMRPGILILAVLRSILAVTRKHGPAPTPVVVLMSLHEDETQIHVGAGNVLVQLQNRLEVWDGVIRPAEDTTIRLEVSSVNLLLPASLAHQFTREGKEGMNTTGGEQEQLADDSMLCHMRFLPVQGVVENAAVKVGHDILFGIVDEQRDAVVMKCSTGVCPGQTHRVQL